jgi:hypothetical protein
MSRLILSSFSFMFAEFKNADDANLALVAMHNHPFDARHQFKVNRFTDIERYEKMDETYVEPETEEYTPRVVFSNPLPNSFLTLAGTSSSMAR